jgi:hypothetical protein
LGSRGVILNKAINDLREILNRDKKKTILDINIINERDIMIPID